MENEVVSGNSFLEFPTLEIYSSFIESLYYFKTLKTNQLRREYYYSFSKKCIDIITRCENEQFKESFNSILFQNITKAKSLRNRSINKYLQKLDPEGFELLGIESELDFDSLKKYFKSAAKRHHPDKGGSNDLMQKINSTYLIFHDVLCKNEYTSSDENNFSSKQFTNKIDNFISFLILELIEIYVDDWDIEAASFWLEKFESMPSYYSNKSNTKIDLLIGISKLTKMLFICNYKNESLQCFELVKTCYKIVKKSGLYYLNELKSTEEVLNSSKKFTYVITHEARSKNLLKLGVITLEKYNNTLIKFNKEKSDEVEKQNSLSKFILKFGLVSDFTNSLQIKFINIQGKLLETPRYYACMYENLSLMQRLEYKHCFGMDCTTNLIRKYTHIRGTNLLRTIIYEKDKSKIQNIIRELLLYWEIKWLNARNEFFLIDLIDVLLFLESLESELFLERINALNYILDNIKKYYFFEDEDEIMNMKLLPSVSISPIDNIHYGIKTGAFKILIPPIKIRIALRKKIKLLDGISKETLEYMSKLHGTMYDSR